MLKVKQFGKTKHKNPLIFKWVWVNTLKLSNRPKKTGRLEKILFMTMKKIITVFLTFIMIFCSAVGCNGQSQPPQGDGLQTLTLAVENGTLNVDGGKDVSQYKVYTSGTLLVTITENSVDLARAIIDNRPIAFGKWKISVEGFNNSNELIATSRKTLEFNIVELNQQTFYSTLKGEYKSTDYFLMSEDIYLYGKGPSNDGSVNDYATITFASDDRVPEINGVRNAMFFVSKPFTATLDGDGYSLNVMVDQHINWSGSQLPFVYGGIFGTVESDAVIKNMQVFSDCTYEVKSRLYASASFVYTLKGRLENIFVSQTNKPIIRPDEKKHDIDNYLDKTDNYIAVLSHVYDGAQVINCVFHNDVFNVAGEMISAGGAVARSQKNVTYNSCAFISQTGSERFFSLTTDGKFYGASAGDFVENGSNIYFYQSLSNFLLGEGKKATGNLTWLPTFEDFSGNALENFGSAWSQEDGNYYLLGKQIFIY